MKRWMTLLLCALASVNVLAQPPAAPLLTPEQELWVSHARQERKNGWIFLHVEGGAEERGFQHGYLLAKEIQEGIRIQIAVWEYQSALPWGWMVKESNRLFASRIDPEFRRELEGIAAGMTSAGLPMDLDQLIAYNASAEFLGSWWPTVKDTISPNAPAPRKESCSSFIATGDMTKDGGIVLAHNTWSDYYYAVFNVVLDLKPDSGHTILMQTSAGLIHSGTDFFITDAGLVGSETTIGDFFPFDPEGVPEFVRMRRATQYASSIDEWCDIMKRGNNGGYANSWLIGDTRTNEIARLELGLKFTPLEKKKNGYFSGSNIAENLQLLRFETRTNELNIRNPSVARRVRWGQLMKKYKGMIDASVAQKLLSDHRDSYFNVDNPGSRSICGHWELDNQASGLEEPYLPLGAYDGKVVDSRMASRMSILARWGSSCGMAFRAEAFLESHPQYGWMAGLIKDRPAEPWTRFSSSK
jgi:hypothetical protein